jgi:hypothetical protein
LIRVRQLDTLAERCIFDTAWRSLQCNRVTGGGFGLDLFNGTPGASSIG